MAGMPTWCCWVTRPRQSTRDRRSRTSTSYVGRCVDKNVRIISVLPDFITLNLSGDVEIPICHILLSWCGTRRGKQEKCGRAVDKECRGDLAITRLGREANDRDE